MKETAAMPRVFIIVLNWNGVAHTIECLESLSRLSYPDYEIIVVDNGSSDGSVETIRRAFPWVLLIENNQNFGYTGGNNVGMYHALQHGADYVWLLNNDTVVDPDVLGKLVAEAESSPEVGLISPLVRYYDDPEKVQYIGAYPDFANFEINPVTDPCQLDDPQMQRLLILYGTALFVRKSVIEKIGFLKARYFAYQEDFDYSLRALQAGFKTRVLMHAHILHKESQTSGKRSPFHVFLMTRNVYFLWKDHLSGFRRMVMFWHYLSVMIGHLKYFYDQEEKPIFNACLEGVWAALRGKGGAPDQKGALPVWFRAVFRLFISWHPYFWINLFKGTLASQTRTRLFKTLNS
ncbi:glycosyltransferase family 2 protein [Pelotalea chapellei]|nr:glycosyltransferase family 2 protein [Pelotalea chapellei]